MKKICKKCKIGEMIEYILQQPAPCGEGYFSPRIMAKCNNCGQQEFIQKLPYVENKISGALEKLK